MEIRVVEHLFGHSQGLHDVRKSRHDGANLDSFCVQGHWKRANHIGETAGLDNRINFGGDREGAN